MVYIINPSGSSTRTIPLYFQGGELYEAEAIIDGPNIPDTKLMSVEIVEPTLLPSFGGTDYCIKRLGVSDVTHSQVVPHVGALKPTPTSIKYDWPMYIPSQQSDIPLQPPLPSFEFSNFGACYTTINGVRRDFFRAEYLINRVNTNIAPDVDGILPRCVQQMLNSEADHYIAIGLRIRSDSNWVCIGYAADTYWASFIDSGQLTPGGRSPFGPGSTPEYTNQRWSDLNGEYGDITYHWDSAVGYRVNGGQFSSNNEDNKLWWPTGDREVCLILSSSKWRFSNAATPYPTLAPTALAPTLPTPQPTPRPTLDYGDIRPGGYVGVALFAAAWVAFVLYMVRVYCST
jgi:hypothetical protein